MSTSERLLAIRERYDKRAPTYDQETGFHPKQAAEYIEWMSIQPGDNILDLACGTGAVTIPAAKVTGPSGSVIGVDISPASLTIAREKASKADLNVSFVEHNIENLDGLESHGIEDGKFNIITCASAVALIEDPSEAVKVWARLLKKGGKMIFDVPTGGTLIKFILLERAAKEIQVDVFRHRLYTAEVVQKLLTDAGLDSSETFVTDSYESGTEELDVKKAGETFDEMFEAGKWTEDWYKELAKPDQIDKLRDAFRNEIEKICDKDGKVTSELKLVMAVGKKL
ncbi:hypothetical protein EG329_001860 [Mollisiaceae sp. DMI_Dod_QoI]|nr:hypothetical protein EG329_001860 [Helotiales sp. DMI_Dod_QoI]